MKLAGGSFPRQTSREFIKISERKGVSGNIEKNLVKQQEKLFQLWHRVRDGTLTRAEFKLLVPSIRNLIKSSLQEAADYEIGSKEKTPFAKLYELAANFSKLNQLYGCLLKLKELNLPIMLPREQYVQQ